MSNPVDIDALLDRQYVLGYEQCYREFSSLIADCGEGVFSRGPTCQEMARRTAARELVRRLRTPDPTSVAQGQTEGSQGENGLVL